MSLEQGSLVTYKAHPEWGPGVVEWINPATGLLMCSFEIHGEPYADGVVAPRPKPAAASGAACRARRTRR